MDSTTPPRIQLLPPADHQEASPLFPPPSLVLVLTLASSDSHDKQQMLSIFKSTPDHHLMGACLDEYEIGGSAVPHALWHSVNIS